MKEGKRLDDVWVISKSSDQSSGFEFEYPTQKPERLLKNIIETSTNKGDIVLDFFAGSGTTPAVAERLGRRWIAMDVGKYAVYTMQERLNALHKTPFFLYSGGLYDEAKSFSETDWKLFAMQLYGCTPQKKAIKGLVFDGHKHSALVKVFSPHELKQKGAKISQETIEEIDKILGSSTGSEIYIIAPKGQFDFPDDEIEIKNRVFYILRVPYSMLAKFTENFTALAQPKDTESINAIIDAVGFDFMHPPSVDFEIKGDKLIIKSFKSNSRIRGESKSELAMIMIDYDYNGDVFGIDQVIYNRDIYIKDKETKTAVLRNEIQIKAFKGKAMFIFLDNAGNELKKVVSNG
jgi:site-specific DNA-methyltransferase (adenine-specific)/adenine-specific DNA-methyltransferase